MASFLADKALSSLPYLLFLALSVEQVPGRGRGLVACYYYYHGKIKSSVVASYYLLRWKALCSVNPNAGRRGREEEQRYLFQNRPYLIK